MIRSQLSLNQGPDIAVPLRFFMTAPLFIIISGFIMLYYGPDIFQNRWQPETLALTHSITLGFITMVIIGSLFQILPVLTACEIPNANRVSLYIYLLITPGIVSLLLGFLSANSLLFQLALALLASALSIFIFNIGSRLILQSISSISSNGLKLSLMACSIAIVLALALLTAYALPQIPLMRQFTELHILWASVGWILVTAIVIAHQVVPMFMVTGQYPVYLQKYVTLLIILTLFILTILRIYENQYSTNINWLSSLVVLIISLSIISFVIISFKLLLYKHKRISDSRLWFWISSLLSLSLSLISYLVSPLIDGGLNILIAILFYAGFSLSVISGMLLKIVPFLLWLHIRKHSVATKINQQKAPLMSDIITDRDGRNLFVVYFLAYLSTLISLLLPEYLFYIAATLWIFFGTRLFLLILISKRQYCSRII